MTINELLQSKKISISTSATKLSHMLSDYKCGSEFKQAFAKVEWKLDGENQQGGTALRELIYSSMNDFKQILGTDKQDHEVLSCVIENIIDTKKLHKQNVIERKVSDSINVPDYLNAYEYREVPIFRCVTLVKPNEHDVEFYKHFILVGDQIAYCHNEDDGSESLQILQMDAKNEALSLGIEQYSSDNSLYDKIFKDMADLYGHYITVLKSELAVLDREALVNASDEGKASIIEEIFIKKVPTSFRNFLKVVSCWKSSEQFGRQLEKFTINPLNNYGMMRTLEFNDFLDYLTKNFTRMTRGALYKQDKYLTWSNDYTHKSVNTWILPSDEVWKKAEIPAIWKDFLGEKASERLMTRLYWYLGAVQDASNTTNQYLVISDDGGTGKSTLTDLLMKILPKNSMKMLNNIALDDNDQFGLSGNKVYEGHLLYIPEYNGKSLATSKGKAITGGDTLSLNVKNKQPIIWNTYGTKVIALTNEGCSLKDYAIRRRTIPLTFKPLKGNVKKYEKAELDELVASGRDFMNYCYRVYKECPFQRSGNYIVMNEEQERQFLENGVLDDDDAHRLLKAFSQDDESSKFFEVGDFEDREEFVDFENIFNQLFEITNDPNDFLNIHDFKDIVEEFLKDKDNSVYRSCFNFKNYGNELHICEKNDKQWFKFSNIFVQKQLGIAKKQHKLQQAREWVFFGIKPISDEKAEEYKKVLAQLRSTGLLKKNEYRDVTDAFAKVSKAMSPNRNDEVANDTESGANAMDDSEWSDIF